MRPALEHGKPVNQSEAHGLLIALCTCVRRCCTGDALDARDQQHAVRRVLSCEQRTNCSSVLVGGDGAVCRHTLEQECRVLLVHGVLHLLGHDHELGQQVRTQIALLAGAQVAGA